MHIHFLTLKRNTYATQKLVENYLDNLQEFLSYNIKLRNKNSYELYAMANMDNTPIYLNMPSPTTVQITWSKKLILEH